MLRLLFVLRFCDRFGFRRFLPLRRHILRKFGFAKTPVTPDTIFLRMYMGFATRTVPLAAPPIMMSSAGCMSTFKFPCSIKPLIIAAMTTSSPTIANMSRRQLPGEHCRPRNMNLDSPSTLVTHPWHIRAICRDPVRIYVHNRAVLGEGCPGVQ